MNTGRGSTPGASTKTPVLASQALAGRTDPVGAEDGTEPTAAWVGGIGAADVLRGLLLV